MRNFITSKEVKNPFVSEICTVQSVYT